MNSDLARNRLRYMLFFIVAILVLIIASTISNTDSAVTEPKCERPAPDARDGVSNIPPKQCRSFTELLSSGKEKIFDRDLMIVLQNGADPNEHVLASAGEYQKMVSSFTTMLTSIGKTISEPMTRESLFGTPLTLATGVGSPELVRKLLERGADPNLQLHPMLTPPLQNAIRRQNLTMVKDLLSYHADCNQCSPAGNAVSMAVMHWNDQSKDSAEILELVLANGGDVGIKNFSGAYPIVSAIVKNNVSVCRRILPLYKDVDNIAFHRQGNDYPLSFMIAKLGDPDLMKQVFLMGANPDRKLATGETLLSWAGSPEVEELIRSQSKKR